MPERPDRDCARVRTRDRMRLDPSLRTRLDPRLRTRPDPRLRTRFAQATALAAVPMTLRDPREFKLYDCTFIKFKPGEMKLWCWKAGQVVNLGGGGRECIMTGRGLGSTSG